MTDKSHLTPIGFAKPFDKPMSEMWIGDFNLKDAHTLLARDYKGIANGSNGVLVDCDKTFTDLSYKQFNNTDVARCITARYTASHNNHTCESSGVLIRGDNMKIRAALTPDHEEKRQNGRRMKEPGEPSFTLTAQDRHGVAIFDDQGRKNKQLKPMDICPTLRAQSHGNEPKVFGDNVRIRRLTPRECWRLQGFPDEYFDKAKAAGISDTQLYKQAGNGVTVNVSRAIGERLKEVEEHGC